MEPVLTTTAPRETATAPRETAAAPQETTAAPQETPVSSVARQESSQIVAHVLAMARMISALLGELNEKSQPLEQKRETNNSPANTRAHR